MSRRHHSRLGSPLSKSQGVIPREGIVDGEDIQEEGDHARDQVIKIEETREVPPSTRGKEKPRSRKSYPGELTPDVLEEINSAIEEVCQHVADNRKGRR